MTTDKPTITWEEFGRDGNIFFIAAAVRRAYKRAGRGSEADVLSKKLRECGSYGEAIVMLADAVEFVDGEGDDDADSA